MSAKLSYETGTTPDMIDSRDLIEWAEYHRDTELDEEERETLAAIDSLADEGWEDWEYGAQFIREDYFVTYAEELAKDCGMIPGDLAWPLNCIDWEHAARELKYDYSATYYLGVYYYVR